MRESGGAVCRGEEGSGGGNGGHTRQGLLHDVAVRAVLLCHDQEENEQNRGREDCLPIRQQARLLSAVRRNAVWRESVVSCSFAGAARGAGEQGAARDNIALPPTLLLQRASRVPAPSRTDALFRGAAGEPDDGSRRQQ